MWMVQPSLNIHFLMDGTTQLEYSFSNEVLPSGKYRTEVQLPLAVVISSCKLVAVVINSNH